MTAYKWYTALHLLDVQTSNCLLTHHLTYIKIEYNDNILLNMVYSSDTACEGTATQTRGAVDDASIHVFMLNQRGWTQ